MSCLIVVTYYGPTETKGARMRVTCGDFKPKTFGYPYGYDGLRAYECIASMYAESMGWVQSTLVGGWIKGACAGFVRVPKGV